MVKIIISRDRANRYNGFRCIGHTDYAERGSDIICAGVSVLTQTTVMALERLVGLELELKTDQKIGMLDCKWTNTPVTVEKTELLVEMMKLGLKEIQNLYPEHLSLSEAEVLK